MDRKQQRILVKKFENAGDLLRSMYFILSCAILFCIWSLFPDQEYLLYAFVAVYASCVVGGYFYVRSYIKELMRPPPKKAVAKKVIIPSAGDTAVSPKGARPSEKKP